VAPVPRELDARFTDASGAFASTKT
jgi:hypothetical protein